MTHALDPQHSVRQIRRRLFLLLTQAFAAVVLLTILLLTVLIGVVLSRAMQGSSRFEPSVSQSLRAYYLGRGSWEGIEAALLDQPRPRDSEGEWDNTLLLDENDRVLIDGGRTDPARVGQVYVFSGRELRFPIQVNGTTVGTLVVSGTLLFGPWVLFASLLPPVAVIAVFTGLLTLLIGLLLMRRFVSPLADVIAAAQSVAAGDLSARVPVRGPGDLRGLSDSFNRMADALERNDRERRDLLADVAHELRTPLTVMRGRLEGMVDGVYPADEAHVAPVLEETYVLERLVEDLRTLTLAEMRQLHFDQKPVDLGDLAHRAAGLFEAEAGENGVALTVEVEPGLPTVSADPQRVGQVIGNLLNNALRFTPAHGKVEITVRRAGEGVELAVSDSGPGMPEADLPHVFDRFWRGEKSRTRAAGGAGLGLAIARQLVEAQGGTVTAANLPGGGLQVAVVLK